MLIHEDLLASEVVTKPSKVLENKEFDTKNI